LLTLRRPGALRVGRAFIVLGPAGEDWLMNKDIDNCFGDPKEALSRRCGRGVVFYGWLNRSGVDQRSRGVRLNRSLGRTDGCAQPTPSVEERSSALTARSWGRSRRELRVKLTYWVEPSGKVCFSRIPAARCVAVARRRPTAHVGRQERTKALLTSTLRGPAFGCGTSPLNVRRALVRNDWLSVRNEALVSLSDAA
jgi:hypothetical protein